MVGYHISTAVSATDACPYRCMPLKMHATLKSPTSVCSQLLLSCMQPARHMCSTAYSCESCPSPTHSLQHGHVTPTLKMRRLGTARQETAMPNSRHVQLMPAHTRSTSLASGAAGSRAMVGRGRDDKHRCACNQCQVHQVHANQASMPECLQTHECQGAPLQFHLNIQLEIPATVTTVCAGAGNH
jgi:hypothetical protein